MDRSAEGKKLIDVIIHAQPIEEIEKILSGIFSINEVDVLNHSPLYYAITTNPSVEVLNVLITRGAKVNISHLRDAIIHNKNPEIAITLYSLLAPLDQRDLDYLFLLSASNRRDVALLHFFVKEGALLDATIGIDLYPDWEDEIELPNEDSDLTMVEQNAIVLAFYENPSPLSMVKELIDIGVNVDFVDSVGNSILTHSLDDINLLKILIEEGHANIHIIDSIEVSMYLIEKDRDLDKVSKEGKTALHYALCCHLCNNYEVVTSLISHGADVLKEDGDGNSPLVIAREHYAHAKIIRYLENLVHQKEIIS